MLDEFGNLGSDAKRPRIVKRGIEEVAEKVEADEKDKIDHVCFVVHGIGEGCDLKFRPLVECVDDFRDIAASMIDDHLRTHVESTNLSGRIEFIPVSWHQELHRDQNGVDMWELNLSRSYIIFGGRKKFFLTWSMLGPCVRPSVIQDHIEM